MDTYWENVKPVKEGNSDLNELLGKIVAIRSKSSKRFLDGRLYNGQNVLMTNRNPVGDKYLQQTIERKNGLYFIKSCSSNCYLDGRLNSGQPAFVTNRYPYDDKYLQWKIFNSDEEDFFIFESISSGGYLDGRTNEPDALVTKRKWQGDKYFYFQIMPL